MSIVINFDKAKVTALAFRSRDDFAEQMKKLDKLFSESKEYPIFYIFQDPSTPEEEVEKIARFLKKKMKEIPEIEIIQRNISLFPEFR